MRQTAKRKDDQWRRRPSAKAPAPKKQAKQTEAPRKAVQYSAELAEQILDHIIDGKTLKQIEELDGMPSRSVILKWRKQHEDFGSLMRKPWICAPMPMPTRSTTLRAAC